jgi:hypothetical protein
MKQVHNCQKELSIVCSYRSQGHNSGARCADMVVFESCVLLPGATMSHLVAPAAALVHLGLSTVTVTCAPLHHVQHILWPTDRQLHATGWIREHQLRKG